MTPPKGVTRRQFLTGTSVVAASTLVNALPGKAAVSGSHQAPYSPTYFNATEWACINAAVNRIIPPEGDGPAGVDSGVPEFIDRQMELPYGYGAYFYMHGPFVPQSPASLGYQLRYTPREIYRLGISAIDKEANRRWQLTFAQVNPDQQDQLLTEMEKGTLLWDGPPSSAVFEQLLSNVREGYFADPMYGGNKNMGGWKHIGFPGARADFTDWIDQAGRAYPFGPVSINGQKG